MTSGFVNLDGKIYVLKQVTSFGDVTIYTGEEDGIEIFLETYPVDSELSLSKNSPSKTSSEESSPEESLPSVFSEETSK